MAFRFPAAGFFTFDTQTGSDADEFLYTDPVAVDQTLPQAANTARRWCWTDIDTVSTNVGPEFGVGGDPDGFLYTEASSPAAFNDEFYLEFDTTLDASTNNIEVQFKTNQRGDANDCTCVVETNENGAGWVERGATFGGSGDPNKVGSGVAQIWASRSVDLTGLISDASTRIRIKIVFPSAGTAFHNDYGLDEIAFIGTTAQTFVLDGYTKNNDGSILGNCRTHLLRDLGGGFETISSQTSNASTGRYSFTGLANGGGVYQVIAWKDDVPHVFDVTDWVLQPEEE
jgi:hypothetical protein